MVDPHTQRFLPHVGPYLDGINITADGYLYMVLHISGQASNLADSSSIVGAAQRFNGLALGNSDPNIEWWVHFTRVPVAGGLTKLPVCDGWFEQRFDDAYTACMGDGLFRNDLWFTMLMKPRPTLTGGLRSAYHGFKGLIGLGDSDIPVSIPYAERVFVDDFKNAADKVEQGLSTLGVRRLGLRRGQSGAWFSEPDEAYHVILNNFFRPIPVSRGRSGINLDPYTVKYGEMDWHVATGSTTGLHGTIYGLENYPANHRPIMFDALRTANVSMTLTNSFLFKKRMKSVKDLDTQRKKMAAGEDASVSQQKQLLIEQDNVQSGNVVYGSHHMSLAVFSRLGLEDLDRCAARAEALLSNAMVNVTREPRETLKCARYAQLPANAKWRPRRADMPSDFFSSVAALNNIPTGRPRGRWGPAILNLRTEADTEYPYHFHVQGSNQITKDDLGNTIIIGPSSSGKTSLLGSTCLLAARQNARVVVCDKDCGLAPMINAAGGSYLLIEEGVPSGLAPLRALTSSPADISYLTKFIRMLIMADGQGEISPEEDGRMQRAVELQLRLPVYQRGLSGVAVVLGRKNDGTKSTARSRLLKWCSGERLGWVFDGPVDGLDTSKRIMGYDTTSLLNNAEICSPVLSYIFYRTRALIDGRPIVFAADEVWRLDQNEAFSEDNNDQLKTIRKNEGVVILATQSAEDALKSKHAHTFKQQIPTKIFFADADASYQSLVTQLGLTDAEFVMVKSGLGLMKHAFLMKRPSGSVVCRYDLSARPDMISVISGRRSTYDLMVRLKARYGDAPEAWVPHFEEQAPLIVDNPVDVIKRMAA